MHYDFPVITHIDDVLPAIEGREEFKVINKDGHVVIDYAVSFEDTFPDITDCDPTERYNFAVRRECRGLVFCSETGRIIRRAFHKFFNANERNETRDLNLNGKNYRLLDKLDGSLASPFVTFDDQMKWGTMAGYTQMSPDIEAHVENSEIDYNGFSRVCIDQGYTPVFEFCTLKYRVVIGHPVDNLVLTAVRHMRTGEYMQYEEMCSIASEFNIPVVKVIDTPHGDINELLAHVRGLSDTEGYIIRFDDGHMVKCKCEWYVTIHKVKELVSFEKDIIRLILENKMDDILPFCNLIDVDRFTRYSDAVWKNIRAYAARVNDFVREAKFLIGDCDNPKKEFALNYVKKSDIINTLLFQVWDGENAFDKVIETVLKNTNNSTGVEKVRNIIGVRLEDFELIEHQQ